MPYFATLRHWLNLHEFGRGIGPHQRNSANLINISSIFHVDIVWVTRLTLRSRDQQCSLRGPR